MNFTRVTKFGKLEIIGKWRANSFSTAKYLNVWWNGRLIFGISW